VVKYLDVLKIVFKNALVDVGLSVLLLTGVLLGLRLIPYNLAGPIFGTAITLFATGLYHVTNYLLSTTILDYELNVVPLSNDYSKGWVIIHVKNTGKNVAEDAYTLVSIKAKEIGSLEEGYFPEKRHLGEFLDYRDLCGNLAIVNGNPRIENELLPWLLFPEGVAIKVSISPGHSGKLLVFEYERASDGYVIKVPSEGGVGKPRACLWLGFDIKYVFHITTYGKNVRRPLDVELYITMDKLDAITSYRTMSTPISLHFADGELLGKVFDMVLRVLGNDGGITERAADLRMNIFYLVPSSKERCLEEYLRVASGFEALWNELRNKSGPFAEILSSIFGVSYEYAVYLALAKRWDELTSFIMNNHLLSYCIDDVCVMTKLLLNLVITDKEFRERDIGHNFFDVHYNIYHMLERSFIYYIHIPGHFMPALARLLLGYEGHTCESKCDYGEKGKFRDQKYYERRKQCYEDCKRMLNALNGDEYAVYEITSELDSVLQRHWEYEDWVGGSSEESAPPALIKEIIDYVHNNKEPQDKKFFSRAVVELRLPTTSRLRFILILYDLLRAREEFEKGSIDEAIKFVDLAEAHAIIETAKFDPLSAASRFFLVKKFATDLKSKLKGSGKFEISDMDILELLRPYHYHAQTNLAETWP